MSYGGNVIPLPVGQLGFYGGKNPSQMQPGHLPYVDGLDLNGGLLKKEGGAAKLNSSALGSGATVAAGVSWVPTPGTYHTIVLTSDGNLKRDTGAGTFGTTLASSLTVNRDPPQMFCTGGGEAVGSAKKIFMFGLGNQVKVVSGTGGTASSIATPPADWATIFPMFGVLHSGRLWGGGNTNDPHRIYYSTTGNHEDFTGAGSGSLAIYPGEGETLVGGMSFRGILVLWKYPKGVYVVDTRDPTPANWIIGKQSGVVGGVNAQSIIQIDGDILFLDPGGNIYLLSAQNLLGDINSGNISQVADLGPFMRSEINLSKLRRAMGVWYPYRRQAWFTLPRAPSSSDNDIRLMVDFSAGGEQTIPRFLLSRRDVAVSMWMRPDTTTVEKPVTGDASGFIWLMDQDVKSKDGAAYPMIFETASTDLSFLDPRMATLDKTGQFLELISEPSGDWNLAVEIYWDGLLTDSLLYGMGGGIVGLDTFTLDTDALAGTDISAQRQKISGSGRRLKLIVKNLNAGEDVAIAEFLLSFMTMDERQRVDL